MLVAIEGIDGAGKTTQARLLYRKLDQLGVKVRRTFEPGDTPAGNWIRKFLRGEAGLVLINSRTELLLHVAARAQHVSDVVIPALRNGTVVVSDRYAVSSLAYQGYGQGLNRRFISAANRFATQGVEPDLTIILDLDPEVGIRRNERSEDVPRREVGGATTRDELKMMLQSVRYGYLDIAQRERRSYAVVDGAASKARVHRTVMTEVLTMLKRTALVPK